MDSNQANEAREEQIQEILRFVRSAQHTLQNTSESLNSGSNSTASSPGNSVSTSNSMAQGFGSTSNVFQQPFAGFECSNAPPGNLLPPIPPRLANSSQVYACSSLSSTNLSFPSIQAPGPSSGSPSPFTFVSSFGSQQQTPRVSSPSFGFAFQGAPRTMTSPSTVGEMRRNFAPYPTHSRSRGGTRTRSQPSPTLRPIEISFFCLGGPQEINPPTNERRRELVSHFLGPSIVTVDRCASGEVVAAAIRNQFPQLLGIEFELVRSSGQGYGSILTRIQHSTPVPGVSAISKSRATVVYVRPFQEIITEETNDQDTTDNLGSATFGSSSNDSPIVSNAGDGFETSNSANDRMTSNRRSSPSGSQPSTSGGFHFNTVISNSQDPDDDNFATMEEYRDHMFRRNPGDQLIIVQSRDNFIQELLGIYKDPNFDFKKRTRVVFNGEQGRDVNGLTREFFSSGIQELDHGRVGNHTLFQGEMDHRVPSCHPTLLATGVYKMLGKFLAHSAIHYGFGFVGLSKSILKYVFSKNFDDTSLVKIEDIPDIENRYVVNQIIEMTSGVWAPSDSERENITTKLHEAGIYENLERSNLHLIAQQFLLYCTIYSRLASLKEIREGIIHTGFFQVLADREYFVEAAFPSNSDADVSAEEILNRVTYVGFNNLYHAETKERFERYIHSLATPVRKRLLEAWTGAAIIPREGLQVRMTMFGPVTIQTCLSQLTISTSCELEVELTRFCNYGSRGFGSI